MEKAYCEICKYELKPAPARFDGEPCYVGYLPCPYHPHAEVTYNGVKFTGWYYQLSDGTKIDSELCSCLRTISKDCVIHGKDAHAILLPRK